jgi:alpha-galactosidase
MRRILLLAAACFLPVYVAYAQLQPVNFNIPNYHFTLSGDLNGFKADFSSREEKSGLSYITLRLSAKEKITPSKLSVKWDVPMLDIKGTWTPGRQLSKNINPNWKDAPLNSRAATNAPVVLLYGNNDDNKFTFACSDALNSVNLLAGVNETTARVDCEIQLFNEAQPAIDHYEITIRLDTRVQPYWNALNDVAKWWAAMPMYKPAPVPAGVKMPMYSTWYSYHQNFTPQQILQECKLSKALGCQTVIVDDGWQTLDSSLGYAYTGDWDPLRIPDMKDYVVKVHQTGMKIMLWYSVPFVGEKSKTYPLFKGKYINYKSRWKAYVLDPRFPEVRQYLIDKYVDALKTWNIDGFKLDFVDSFIPDDNAELTAAKGRDYASVNEAVDKLLTDVLAKLREVKPDIMVEFRQSYIGPLMRKYGNMFRAGDAPYDALSNRVRTTDIKLLSGNTATHSDMLMWNNSEKTEVAALQLLNILFSVPQISVKLADIPKEHRDMLTFWLNFWLKNKDVLLDGDFEPHNPDLNYPVITAKLLNKQVTAIYSDQSLIKISGGFPKVLNLVNAKISAGIVIDADKAPGRKTVTIFNCTGKLISSQKTMIHSGLSKFNVPAAGLVCIQ